MYNLKNPETSESVERKYLEITWFYQQIRREFPGLRITPIPQNDILPIQHFFDTILKHHVIGASYLLRFFCLSNDEAKIKEFVKNRNAFYPEEEGFRKLKSFFTDNHVVKLSELDELQKKAAKTPGVVKAMTADYSNFTESLLETCQSVNTFISRISKSLQDVEELYNKISIKFQEVSQNFSSIVFLVKKLNYAKTQFPSFDESQINLDIILLKLKNGIDGCGFVKSKN